MSNIHFIEEETEAQRSQVTCLWSKKKWSEKRQNLNAGSVDSGFQSFEDLYLRGVGDHTMGLYKTETPSFNQNF